MPVFEGTVRVVGHYGSDLHASLAVGEGRLLVTTGEAQIGNWALEQVSLVRDRDGFHLRVEGEELVLKPDDEEGFAQAVSPPAAGPKRRALWRRERSPKVERPAARPPELAPQRPAGLPSQPGNVAGLAAPSEMRTREKDHDPGPVAEASRPTRQVTRHLPPWWRWRAVALMALVLLGGLAVVSPTAAVMLLMVVGGVILLAGTLTTVDLEIASHLPPTVSPNGLLAVGLGLIMIGFLIGIVT